MRNIKFRNQLVKQLKQLVESRGQEFNHNKLQSLHMWCDFSYIRGGRRYKVLARVTDANPYYDDGTSETDTNRAHFQVSLQVADVVHSEYQMKRKIFTATEFLKLAKRHLPQAQQEAA